MNSTPDILYPIPPVEMIIKKRNGHTLTPEEIQTFIRGYTYEDIPDYQASALLMAGFLRGMSTDETMQLTKALLDSGHVMDLSDIDRVKLDKHSTGGVGDKTSLVLAPLIAAAGFCVPMISGRGLGHTGGTLDKLESIPGFNVRLDLANFKNLLKTIGVAMIGQTKEIAPADRKLYALRDVTGTVDFIPYISASIMSKKLAESLDALILDVKVGTGAFMTKMEKAEELADSMVSVGKQFGKKVKAIITNMDQPLGQMVGNALEVRECLRIMRGEKLHQTSQDLVDLIDLLAAHMMALGGTTASLEEGKQKSRKLIQSGAALKKFKEIVEAQGGDIRVIDNDSLLPKASVVQPFCAPKDGRLTHFNSRQIGMALIELGGGRKKISDIVDPSVGFVFHKKIPDAVAKGEPICDIHHNGHPDKYDGCLDYLQKSITIT